LKKLRRAAIIGSLLLGACAPVNKADALPRKTEFSKFTRVEAKGDPSNRRIKGRYYVLGYKLFSLSDGKTPVVSLEKTLKEAGVEPVNALMAVDGFPPKMKLEGKLIYLYSPGAKGIAIINPKTKEQTWMSVSSGIQALRKISFEAKNGIIALSGPGADFIGVIGLGDLRKSEAIPIEMALHDVLGKKGHRYLADPKVTIIGNRVYVQDAALGSKKYFFEVVNGVALPVTVESD